MAMYNAGDPTFRLGAKPAAEARMWMASGFAGGIQPWWHHIGAFHEDRRQYRTAAPMMAWHAANEQYLVDRRPVATVGVVWSQRNTDFYGRNDPDGRTASPYRGIVRALMRARIPYTAVHADHIGRDPGLAALVLPNIAVLSDAQCDLVRQFVANGGGLLATGETSRYDETGAARDDFALADLFGVHTTGAHHGALEGGSVDWNEWGRHSYLRIDQHEHSVLADFAETDILPFGGRLEVVSLDGADAPLTLIPPFPIYPPEKSWMAHPSSAVPALALGERVAYLAADLDRCYDRDRQPDHGTLLAALTRWVARDDIPLQVDGPGMVDCRLYAVDAGHVLHLVGVTDHSGPIDELPSGGPYRVRVRAGCRRARLLVAEADVDHTVDGDWVVVEIPRVVGHEVLLLES
jgi:hypothetical protein